MKVYSLYILNKAGGLIYQNDVNPELNKLTANDYLVLAGTLHGVHAIASNLTPSIPQSSGTTADTSFPAPGPEKTQSNATLISSGRSQNPNSNRTGLQSIETDCFNLYIFQTLTGVKFIIITSPNTIVHNVQILAVLLDIEDQIKNYNRGELVKQCQTANELFKLIYVAYSDYVMKNPFYSLDMPIKCSLFDLKVIELVK